MPCTWLLPSPVTSGDCAAGSPSSSRCIITGRRARGSTSRPSRRLRASCRRSKGNRLLNEQDGSVSSRLSQVGLTFLAVYFLGTGGGVPISVRDPGADRLLYPAYVPCLPASCSDGEPPARAEPRGRAHRLDRLHPRVLRPPAAPQGVARRPGRRGAYAGDHGDPRSVPRRPRGVGGQGVCVLGSVGYQLVVGVRLLRSYADRNTVLFFLCCWCPRRFLVGRRPGVGRWARSARRRPARLLRPGTLRDLPVDASAGATFACSPRPTVSTNKLRGQVRDLEERQGRDCLAQRGVLWRQIGRRSADISACLTRSSGSVRTSRGSRATSSKRAIASSARSAWRHGVPASATASAWRSRWPSRCAVSPRARLAREAQIATRVHHPNIVSIVDADVAQARYAYLVMELVEGSSLADCEDGHDICWILEVLAQVLEGVKALHAQNIIHAPAGEHPALRRADVPSAREDHRLRDQPVARGRRTDPRHAIQVAATVQGSGSGTGTRPTRKVRRRGPDDPDSQASLLYPRADAGSQAASTAREEEHPAAHANGEHHGHPDVRGSRACGRTLEPPPPAADVFSFGVVAYRLLAGKPFQAGPPSTRVSPDGAFRLLRRSRPLCGAISCAEAADAIDACLALTAPERPTVDALCQGRPLVGNAGRRRHGHTASDHEDKASR